MCLQLCMHICIYTCRYVNVYELKLGCEHLGRCGSCGAGTGHELAAKHKEGQTHKCLKCENTKRAEHTNV